MNKGKTALSVIIVLAIITVGIFICYEKGIFCKADLSEAKIVINDTDLGINGDKAYEYTGKEIIPDITVTVGSRELVEGKDFVRTFKHNKDIGPASMTLTGIKMCQGETQKDFVIIPRRPVVETVVEDGKIVLKWDNIDEAQYYIVDRYEGSGGERVYKGINTEYTEEDIETGIEYTYCVTALYGEWGIERQVKVPVAPAPVKGKLLGDTVVWDKVNCEGYKIEYGNNINEFKEDFVDKDTVQVEFNGYTFIRITPYITQDNEKIYGNSRLYGEEYNQLYVAYSSNYVNNADRTTNLKLACEEIDGVVIAPGQTFSFNETVGERTPEKGYKKAHVFQNANTTVADTGGGICQVASTLFNAVLEGNLEIAKRFQHSQRVTYVPLGRDAAIYWPSTDFEFTNDTEYPILIKMDCKDGAVTASFYISSLAEKHKDVKLSVSQNGKNFTLIRSVDGEENYRAYSTY